MVAWDTGGPVKVGPWPDELGWSDGYDMTSGCCNEDRQSENNWVGIAFMFIDFNSLVVGYDTGRRAYPDRPHQPPGAQPPEAHRPASGAHTARSTPPGLRRRPDRALTHIAAATQRTDAIVPIWPDTHG